MTAKSILRLNDEKKTFYRGNIEYVTKGETKSLLELPPKEMAALRGIDIAMVSRIPWLPLTRSTP